MTSAMARSSSPDWRRFSTWRAIERGGRLGERDGSGDDGVPAFIDVDRDALVEQTLHVFAALGIGRCEAGMNRSAEDAPVLARDRRGREFALGARQAGRGIVENILVRLGARLEDLGIARQQHEIWRFRARRFDQTGPVALGQLILGQRHEPGRPADLVLSEGDRTVLVRGGDGCFAHFDSSPSGLTGGCGQDAQPGDNADLERQEGD